MTTTITIEYYPVDSDTKPYKTWFNKLDLTIKNMIDIRLARLRSGIYGDCHPLKNSGGVWELRFFRYGGIRIYFGKQSNIVIIVWGGTKSTQVRDIGRAQEYWLNHNRKMSNGKKESYQRI